MVVETFPDVHGHFSPVQVQIRYRHSDQVGRMYRSQFKKGSMRVGVQRLVTKLEAEEHTVATNRSDN